jgi:flagellar assembly protein FliH
MLSKVVPSKDASQLEVQEYVLPTSEDVEGILEVRKQEAKRRKILDEHKDDPMAAAQKEANRILVEAQEKLNEAKLEASALKVRQEKEIRSQMEKEFQTKLEAGLRDLKQNYLSTIENMAKLKEVIYQQSEKELIELVYCIARKVLGDEIKTSPRLVMGMLKKGFEKIKEAKKYDIRIHPGDYDMLTKEKENLKQLLKISGTVNFTKDESVERGGCRIVTDSGEVSVEPGKQVDTIIKELSDET